MNGRRLYEEIGGVSERYLQEASNYRAKRRSGFWRVALIAAAIMLSLAVVLSTLAFSVGLILVDILRTEQPDPPEQEYHTVAAMESALLKSQGSLPVQNDGELGYFDGDYKLIWSESGSDQYYSVRLSKNELRELLYLMQKPRADFTDHSEQPTLQIWICLGDGIVVSPYLKNTAGNTGHGEVFHYDPELEMTPELAAFIADCALT